MNSSRLNWIFFLVMFVLFSSSPVLAQIPFYTADADTTEKGKFHFEFFNEHDWLQKTSLPETEHYKFHSQLWTYQPDRVSHVIADSLRAFPGGLRLFPKGLGLIPRGCK